VRNNNSSIKALQLLTLQGFLSEALFVIDKILTQIVTATCFFLLFPAILGEKNVF